jgi:homoserine O-acetyltransferase/O-succinyltransferase
MNYQKYISEKTQFYQLPQPFYLQSGEIILDAEVAYRTWGKLNASGDNAVLICHALTGSADADDWWEPLFGAGRLFDPETDFILCSNVLGSCYGTTGAISTNPHTGMAYAAKFPRITIQDMVHLQAVLVKALKIQRLKLVIGGSLGGMQVLEWALLYPELVEAIAPIAVSGKHSAWCIGLSEAQRQAIYTDPNWQDGNYNPDKQPTQGLSTARMMAMITYRSWSNFETRFGREIQGEEPEDPYAIANYLQHQGQKLFERFDANTYITLTHAMDSHNLAGNRGNYTQVLRSIQQPTLVIGIDSDILYPPHEQKELASLIPHAQLAWLESPHGHDAFLMDMETLNDLVLTFRTQLYSTVLS